jgi:hypothetical protein
VEFFVRKIRRLRPGSNPRSWVPAVKGRNQQDSQRPHNVTLRGLRAAVVGVEKE